MVYPLDLTCVPSSKPITMKADTLANEVEIRRAKLRDKTRRAGRAKTRQLEYALPERHVKPEARDRRGSSKPEASGKQLELKLPRSETVSKLATTVMKTRTTPQNSPICCRAFPVKQRRPSRGCRILAQITRMPSNC
ncbi:conserved hypothetical protein [Trichinella spiralis]|uniref:hypothetical protein n=1 Tax=Trichinella spiralis TaxID=6334 RepID=UPI0001EFE6F1|nr:conserved hypothetical protein [Trichinella spiralis]